MLSEVAVVFNLNDIVRIFWILVLKVLQDAQLNTRLMLVPLLVLDDLDCHYLVGLVIETP